MLCVSVWLDMKVVGGGGPQPSHGVCKCLVGHEGGGCGPQPSHSVCKSLDLDIKGVGWGGGIPSPPMVCVSVWLDMKVGGGDPSPPMVCVSVWLDMKVGGGGPQPSHGVCKCLGWTSMGDTSPPMVCVSVWLDIKGGPQHLPWCVSKCLVGHQGGIPALPRCV